MISIDPDSSVPVLLLFARDEMAARPWAPPGRHWPEEHPALVGGLDLRDGGTWLAVQPGETRGERRPSEAAPRAVCLLNGLGTPAPADRRLTRGRLPLAAAEGMPLDQLDLPRYDPFHLLIAESGAVRLLTWDGVGPLREISLERGTHLVSNRGLEDGSELPQPPERAVRLIDARIRYFAPLLRETPRPEPMPQDVTTAEAWGEWMRLADGDGLDTSDLRALIGKHDWGEGQVWLTSSVSLLALGRNGLRYDVNLEPGTGKWYQVETDG